MICKRALRRWRAILAATAAGLVVLSVAGRCRASLSDCADAVCRIAAADGSCGSGCVFEIDGQWVYVLTAAHVVGENAAVQCEFWRNGHKSEGLAGQVSRRNADVDAAVVAVPAASLGGVLPSAIPLAPRGTAVQAGQTLVSIGCANGAWATAWKGHAVPGDADELRFVPSPANGRSGSPILNAEGSQIVGILVARTMDNAEGIGVPIAAVYRAFDAKKSRVEREELRVGPPDSQLSTLNSQLLTQCGPNGCPNCPQRKYVVPHLFGNASPNQGGPWPSLTPPAPSVNLTPLDEKLGRIAGMLEEMRRPMEPPLVAAAPPGPDPATAEMLQRHGQAIEQLRADVPKQINAAVEPVADAVKKFGKSVEETNENIAKHGTLLERLAAERAKVAAEEPGASKAKQDVDALKLEISQHKVVFFTVLGGLVLVLLGIHTYLQKSGQPDPIQTAVNALTTKVDAAAAANPALAPLAAGQNAVNGLVNQLAGQVAGLQQQVAAVQQQATAQSGQIAAVATAVPPPAATAAAPAAATVAAKPAGT